MIWLIGLGGSFGAAGRFLLGSWIDNRMKAGFPLPAGTLAVNIAGSFLFGISFNLYHAHYLEDWFWYLMGLGFCGSFTTFSTFGYEMMKLLQLKKIKWTILYTCGSVVFCIAAAALGMVI